MVDEDFAWRLAQDLVKIDSSDPGAYEDEIERFIKRLIEQQLAQLDSSALDAVQIEELEVLPGRRNLMVTAPGLSDEPRLVYICHMDTVTLGDGWDASTPPLGATVRNDKLYGRGACDMKGGLACAIAVIVHVLERIATSGELPRRGFSLICSVDEEDFMPAPRPPSVPAGSARANGCWTPSPPTGRFRWRTRGARGSKLRWPASRRMRASLGRAPTPSPPCPRSCVRFAMRSRRCPCMMSWGL